MSGHPLVFDSPTSYIGKKDPDNLIGERLWINGILVLDYDYADEARRTVDRSLCGDLKIGLAREQWQSRAVGKAMTPFLSVMSTGTAVLFLYFVWSISSFDTVSLLFIDEFDAFLHFEAAERIVLRLNRARGFQTVLTSHNTYLMQNRLTRPDCCFIMTRNRVTSLFNSTEKEIREAHNLEKMYVNGAFNG